MNSDLYVLGIGPRFVWSPCPFLDAFASVSFLIGISDTELDADGVRASDTEASAGVGAAGGLAVYFGSIGIFGEAGYEYLDPSEISAGGLTARTDFSAFTFTVGLTARF